MPGEGDESAFLRGEARGLTTQAQMILPYRSAEDLLENVILPCLDADTPRNVDTPRFRGFNERVKWITDIWSGGESGKRMDFHRTLATAEPIAPNRAQLREGIMYAYYRDTGIGFLLAELFDKEDHLSELPHYWETQAEKKPDTGNLTAVRRIVHALRSQFEDDFRNGHVQEYDPEILMQNRDIFNRFISDQEPPVPVGIQKEMAEVIVFMTPESGYLPPSVLWYALLSENEEVADRTSFRLRESIDTRNINHEYMYNPAIDNDIASLIETTKADRAHRVLWDNFNKLVFSVRFPRVPKIFKALREKLIEHITPEDLRRLISEKPSDPASLGSIYGAMDGILNHPENAERISAFIHKRQADNLLNLLLDKYLRIGANADNWFTRTRMINLAETLGKLCSRPLTGEIRKKIEEVSGQPQVNYASQAVVAYGEGGGLRLTEFMAATKLSRLLDEFPDETLD